MNKDMEKATTELHKNVNELCENLENLDMKDKKAPATDQSTHGATN